MQRAGAEDDCVLQSQCVLHRCWAHCTGSRAHQVLLECLKLAQHAEPCVLPVLQEGGVSMSKYCFSLADSLEVS